MKQQISPAVAGVIIVLLLAVAGFFLWRGTSGGVGSKAPGEVGGTGPFSPGGEAVGKGGMPGKTGAPSSGGR